jgi:hypothetical protein
MECHIYDIPKENKFKRAPPAGKKLRFTVFWNEKGVILVNYMWRVPTVISDCYSETPKCINVCLHQVHPTRTMSEVSLLHNNAWLHTSAHTTQTITNFGWTELPPLPYSSDIGTSDYHLSGPLKKKPAQTPLYQ